MEPGVTLLAALKKLAELELQLSIDEPRRMRTGAAYTIMAPRGKGGLKTPCWMHNPQLIAPQRLGVNGFRQSDYTIHIQMLAGRAGNYSPVWSEVALSFFAAFADMVAANQMLGDGQMLLRNLRTSGDDLVTILQGGNGLEYVGLDLFLDLTINDQATVGAGA